MPAKIDLTGQRFGRLLILELTNKRAASGHKVWQCQCSCGKIVYVSSNSLRRGRTKSCGCLHKELTSKLFLKDLTGKKFGRLLILKLEQKRSNAGKTMYKCLCDCGNIVSVLANSFTTSGHTQSCGCIVREMGEIAGQRFGRLVALNRAFVRDGNYFWKCQCDCGNIVFVNLQNLKFEVTKSCGCFMYATRFVQGTNIDPMNVPFEITRCMQARTKLRKAIKQAV